MTTPRTQETPAEWMLRQINVFAESFPNWNLDTPAARLRLAQHLAANWEMAQQARAMLGWTHTTASSVLKITGRGETPSLLPVDDYEPRAADLRPSAILPDVRDVVTSYETIVARLKARVQNLADLLQDEVNRDTAALDEMRRTLDEMREVTA